jgi:GT2 family glycosyltransferase
MDQLTAHTNSTGIVLINYFNDEEVISFIENYLLQHKDRIQIYVLNNGSSKGVLKDFCKKNVQIQYQDPGKNLGYIGGFLHVINSLTGQKPHLMILSNTDIEIDQSIFEGIRNVKM